MAFGLGLGATLVNEVDGIDYVEFVGTGMVATAAVIFAERATGDVRDLCQASLPATYDAILAAPVYVEELVTAEMLWIGIRAGFYGTFPLIVTMVFGLDPRAGDAAGAPLRFITALGFAGLRNRGRRDRREDRPVQLRDDARDHAAVPGRGHVLPDRPAAGGVQVAAQFNPLHQLVELVRHARFGFKATDLLRIAFLAAFAVGLWRVAVQLMSERLID